MKKHPTTLALSDREIAEGETEFAHYQNAVHLANLALAKAIDQSVEEGNS